MQACTVTRVAAPPHLSAYYAMLWLLRFVITQPEEQVAYSYTMIGRPSPLPRRRGSAVFFLRPRAGALPGAQPRWLPRLVLAFVSVGTGTIERPSLTPSWTPTLTVEVSKLSVGIGTCPVLLHDRSWRVTSIRRRARKETSYDLG